MKQLSKRSLFVVTFMALTMFLVACGGGNPGPKSTGNSQSNYDETGQITGTLDGESFVRYTVGRSVQGQFVNTAGWRELVNQTLSGFPTYEVNIQGHETKSGTNFENAITIEFYLDDEFQPVHFGFDDEPPSISYFPTGLTFNVEEVYSMTSGTLDVDNVEKDGDTLKVSGSFAGTLERWEWTDQLKGEGAHVDPMQIEGQFNVQRVTRED